MINTTAVDVAADCFTRRSAVSAFSPKRRVPFHPAVSDYEVPGVRNSTTCCAAAFRECAVAGQRTTVPANGGIAAHHCPEQGQLTASGDATPYRVYAWRIGRGVRSDGSIPAD